MTEPDVTVTLTDSEFSLNELEEFIARARAVDGMPQNALVSVRLIGGKVPSFTLSASTAYRGKDVAE
ncbi:hypothetical protein NLX62_00310 [Mycobacteriaceae bacterium Msp059]|nr:hypothetical protein [Mycobacteriaceae bacterium Msp059]